MVYDFDIIYHIRRRNMLTNIHLRGLDGQLIHKLKHTAAEQKISANKLILKLLQQGLGLSPQKVQIYHDLDVFAGTWSAKEAKEFLKNNADFEQIETGIWK